MTSFLKTKLTHYGSLCRYSSLLFLNHVQNVVSVEQLTNILKDAVTIPGFNSFKSIV